MNEEALQYSYNLFSKDVYNGSIEDYQNLISTNQDALNYYYNLFTNDGYSGDINEFSKLLISEKQIESTPEEVEKLNIQESKEDKSDLIKSKETNFDKGIFKMAEREAYDKYKETGEIDLELLPEEEKPNFLTDKIFRLAR